MLVVSVVNDYTFFAKRKMDLYRNRDLTFDIGNILIEQYKYNRVEVWSGRKSLNKPPPNHSTWSKSPPGNNYRYLPTNFPPCEPWEPIHYCIYTRLESSYSFKDIWFLVIKCHLSLHKLYTNFKKSWLNNNSDATLLNV